ncbi:MAG TPA: hypothetical protein VHZ24_19795 [Pirellulales bacterium]|nr:hypothetical protein [Pirellulales bacterium]
MLRDLKDIDHADPVHRANQIELAVPRQVAGVEELSEREWHERYQRVNDRATAYLE